MSEPNVNGNRTLSNLQSSVAGAVSGAVTRAVCQPLDVVKIRFQLQVEPLKKDAGVKYWGILQAFQKIVHEEGVSALWKGHVPAQLLSIIYGITQFGSFEFFSRLAPEHLQTSPSLHLFSGSAAGCVATVVSFPCDVLRTRLVAQGEPKIYRGLCHATTRIFIQEGPTAFFKGLLPTVLQIVPHAGAQFAFYSFFKEVWRKLAGDKTDPHSTYSVLTPVSFHGSLASGSLAGLCAKAVVYPLDLARKRLQIQGFEEARQHFGQVFYCKGLLDCLYQTVKEEQLIGLFKGLSPSLLKASLSTAFHFAVYQETLRIIHGNTTN